MNITYTQNGDYLIPNIVIRKTKPLGHYGRLRKAYLEMHRPILFNELVLSDRVSFSTPSTYRNRLSILSPFVHLLSFYPTAPAFSDLLSGRLLPAAAFWFYDLHVYRYQITELLPVFVEQPATTIRFP